MDIEIIPLSQLQKDTAGLLTKCCDAGQPVVVELPDHRFVAIQPLDADDQDDTLVSDLIDTNADFRALVEKSAASPRKPFGTKAVGPN
jgi:hypothetical protein